MYKIDEQMIDNIKLAIVLANGADSSFSGDRLFELYKGFCSMVDELNNLSRCVNSGDYVDPVSLAGGCYCKYCEYWDKEHPVMLPGMSVPRCACTFFSIDEVGKNYTKSDDFCSYGEFGPLED